MRFKKYTALLFVLAAFAPQVQAHDFWLAPDAYTAEPKQDIALSFMIGHPADRMMWPAAPHRIVAFRSIGPKGVQDQQAHVMDAVKPGETMLNFEEPGLHILTLETTHAVSELDAEKFNAYLEEEGLTPIQLDRTLKGTTEHTGTEIYSRRGKALIQIGALGEVDPDYLSKPVGLTLEIVTEKHPARVKSGEMMSATIYYRGKPAKGITIGLIDLKSTEGLIHIEKSDRKGRVKFARPAQGDWMLHAVWSSPLEGSDRANYDTVFSSLSFSLD